ncbi:MAG: hypothetical protein OXU77_14575 [Gammaproteobacteria bacterium]|nr:hypothetical protein [Gammaproteobacteria bacterium]
MGDVVNTVGLVLDILGFAVLMYLALPRNVGQDIAEDDPSLFERSELGKLLRKRRPRRLRILVNYKLGCSAVIVGFLLQIVATWL